MSTYVTKYDHDLYEPSRKMIQWVDKFKHIRSHDTCRQINADWLEEHGLDHCKDWEAQVRLTNTVRNLRG